jgi:ribosomal protein S18 acetylase RimI-like enzyme
VSGPEILPFADEHVDAAAALLAARHARHREAEPLLPADVDFRALVESARGEGAVALRDGTVAGYLLGERREDDAFGRHVWIDRAGYAVREPELVRDLYAATAQAWVDDGHVRHFALVPALPTELEPWLALGYGRQQAHGVRGSAGPLAAAAADLTIRRAGADDLDASAPLAMLIWRHQAASPVFAGVPEPPPGDVRTNWRETLEDPEVAYFLARRDGRPVGHVLLYPAGAGLGTPDGALNLAIVAALPEERGAGVGVALTEHALAWAREHGHPALVADWRVTNLLSSRFFPRRGFRVAFERLYRSIP